MEKHSDSTMFYYYCIPAIESTQWTNPTRDQYSCLQSGRTPRGLTVDQVHRVDGAHNGSIFMSTKWTDPTRVNCLTKSTKWTDPTRDQYLGPQSGQTPRGINIHVHKVDGPHEVSIFMSTKWTDHTRVNC